MRRAAAPLLGLLLCAVLGAVPARADVGGTYTLDALMLAEGVQTEAVKFDIDLRSNLILNVTLSGLTFGADLGFGSAGPEFAIAGLTTDLGAITIFDQFVFAVPYYNAGDGVDASPRDLVRTVDAQGGLNGLSFAKARFGLDFDVAGFTISNLAILEDVDFPHPFLYTDRRYHAGGVNSVVDDQTPTIGFGDLITLQGQTAGRVTVRGSTGFCISAELNVIKQRSWPWSVNKACTAGLGLNDPDFVIENGAKTPAFFDFEQLSLSGLSLGGVTMELLLTWTPQAPLHAEWELTTQLAGLIDARLVLESADAAALTVSQIDLELNAEAFELRLLDAGGDLIVDRIFAIFATTLNANQNPANLTVYANLTRDQGLVYLQPVLTIARGDLSLNASAVFDANGAGSGIDWASARFAFTLRAGMQKLSLTTTFAATGIKDVLFSYGTVF